MKKTCSVNKKCLSFSLRLSLPARCKFNVLIFKFNFRDFDLLNPRIDFLVFFENKALLEKTNHLRFLLLAIPIYVQNMKEIEFLTSATESSMFAKSRS